MPWDNLLKYCTLLRSRRTSEEITTRKFLLSVGIGHHLRVGLERVPRQRVVRRARFHAYLWARGLRGAGWPLGAGRGSRTAGASRAVAAARAGLGGRGCFPLGAVARRRNGAGKPVAPRSPRESGDAAEAADRVSPSWRRRELPGRDRANAKSGTLMNTGSAFRRAPDQPGFHQGSPMCRLRLQHPMWAG